MADIHFPNESGAYREARNKLLESEKELRAHVERVAEERRNLPSGGELKENYVFEEKVNGKTKETKVSELFKDGDEALFVYS
jgi:predicted dithiol-disulfide oxidoreductase (DUF899 family)